MLLKSNKSLGPKPITGTPVDIDAMGPISRMALTTCPFPLRLIFDEVQQ